MTVNPARAADATPRGLLARMLGACLCRATVYRELAERTPIAQAAVPDPFPPAWRQGRSRDGRAVMSLGPEARYGFTDLVATERYLYGLFSGRSVDAPGTPWATREVQVYTWEGAYVKTIHLARAAEAMTVDASDTWLYASGPDPAPWVARFRLPEPGQ